MQKLYDDEKTTDKPGQHDRLPMSDEVRQAETEALEAVFDTPSTDQAGFRHTNDAETIGKIESGGSENQKLGVAESVELDKLGEGYRAEPRKPRTNRLAQAFSSMSPRRKLGLGAAGLGGGVLTVAGLLAMFSLIGIFRLDHFMNNIEQRAFTRYQVNMEGRSSKWINAYLVLRLSEVENPNVAPKDRDNLIFRSNRVDTNSPLTDWYRTMRATSFENDIFEKQGIKFASSARVVGNKTIFRPAKITINDKPITFELTPAEIKAIEDGDINGYNDRLSEFIDIEFLESNKEGRKAIKEYVKANTKSYQFVKRYYIRKSIQNMTGITNWTFFETSRERAAEKRISIRNKIIQNSFPESGKSGRLVQCIFGIIKCSPQPDPADSENHSTLAPSTVDCTSNPTPECSLGDIDNDPDTPDAVNDGSAVDGIASGSAGSTASVQKSIIRSLAGKLSGPLSIVSTLDTLNTVDKAIGDDKLVDMVYMARMAQAIGLFTTFGIARDQVHTGQVNSTEINEMMSLIANVGPSQGWNEIVAGNEAGASKAAKEAYCSPENQAKISQEKYRSDTDEQYNYLCPQEQIGSTDRAEQIQTGWDNVMDPFKPVFRALDVSGITAVIGVFNTVADAVLGPVTRGILSALNLDDNIEGLVALVTTKAAGAVGAGPMFSEEAPGGVYANHVLQGAAASAESAMRFSGAALTTNETRASYQRRAVAYEQSLQGSRTVFDRYLNLSDSRSVASASLFSATSFSGPADFPSSFASTFSSSISRLFGLANPVRAAIDNTYAASSFAGVQTYDFPDQCIEPNPIETLLKGAQANQTNADDLGLIPATELTWELLRDSNAFYARLYSLNPESAEIQKVYNCGIIDSMASGGIAGRFAPGLAGPNAIAGSAVSQPTATDGPAEETEVPLSACYTVTKQRGSRTEGQIFHQQGSQTYAFENSPVGIRFAARDPYDSIDIDLRLTKDGIPVATHWERPMVQDGFYDPTGKIPQNTTVQDMTFEEISRLRNRDGQSQILSIDQIAPLLAENNVNLSLEFKVASLVGKLPEITTALNTHNVKAIIKADATKDALDKALKAARNYGYWTRGTERSQDWKPPGPSCQ